MQTAKKKATPRLTKEPRRKDPYRSKTKPAGTPQCPKCLAFNVRGSWVPQGKSNGSTDGDKHPSLLCPACRQLKEKYAMGVVELHGENYRKNKKVIVSTLQKTEKILRVRNDQERILWTNLSEGVLKIYVSLPELARQMGRELEKAFKGITEYSHSPEEPYLRVRWWSDAESGGHEPGAPLRLKKKNPMKPKSAPKPKSKAFRGRSKQ